MVLLRTLSILLCFLVLFACSKDPNDTDAVFIETDFELRLTQLIENNIAIPALDIVTTQQEFCSDTEILFSQRNNNTSVEIVLEDIVNTEDCELPVNQAKAAIRFPSQPSNTWQFTLLAKEIEVATGTVREGTEGYSIEIQNNEGILSQNKSILKLPSNHIYGYHIDTDTNPQGASGIVEPPTWLNQLGTTSDEIASMHDYGIFITDSEERKAFFPIINRTGYIIAYDDGQLENIKMSLAEIREDNQNLEIHLHTSSGEEL